MPGLLAPLIVAALPSTAASIAGVSAASVLANVIFTGALIGAQYALAAGRSPAQSQRQTIQQSDAPRAMIVGRMQKAGVTHCYEASGTLFALGLVVCHGPVDGIEDVILDGEIVTISGVDYSVTSGRLAGFASVEFRNAEAAGHYSDLLTTPPFDAIWTTDHKCVELTCLYGRFYFGSASSHKVYVNGFPRLEAVYRGVRVYDPRDGAQSPDDTAGWLWSDNPILLAAWYITRADGGRKAMNLIDWDSVATAADACDALVTKYGSGTRKFARCNGEFTLAEEVRAVMARFMACCDGSYYETPEGLIGFRVATYVAPRVTLTDADVSRVRWLPNTGALADFNRVNAKYIEPGRGYQMVDAPPVADDDAIAVDGERVTALSLDFCPDAGQAYALATRHLRREVGKARVEIDGGPNLMRLFGETTVALDLEIAGISGVFEISQIVPSGGLEKWSAVLKETGEDVYQHAVPPVEPLRAIPMLTAPSIETPVPTVTVVVVGGGNVLDISTTTPVEADMDFIAQFRTSDTGSGAGSWLDYTVRMSAWSWQSPALPDGDYDTQCWFRNAIGQNGPVATAGPTTIGGGAPAPPAWVP